MLIRNEMRRRCWSRFGSEEKLEASSQNGGQRTGFHKIPRISAVSSFPRITVELRRSLSKGTEPVPRRWFTILTSLNQSIRSMQMPNLSPSISNHPNALTQRLDLYAMKLGDACQGDYQPQIAGDSPAAILCDRVRRSPRRVGLTSSDFG